MWYERYSNLIILPPIPQPLAQGTDASALAMATIATYLLTMTQGTLGHIPRQCALWISIFVTTEKRSFESNHFARLSISRRQLSLMCIGA